MYRNLLTLLIVGFTSLTSFAQTMADNYPPRMEELKPTSGYAPEFQQHIQPAVREQVPLTVDWADNELTASRVTFGVPFARGALSDVANIRLVNDQGEAIPAEVRRTATWDGPEGPVRWALVHTTLQRDRQYTIEYGSEVEPAAPSAIEITEDDQQITVDTGPLQVVISRSVPSVLQRVTLQGQTLVDAAGAELPVVTDGQGNRYVAGDLQAEVVERGPGRVAIRREGWYQSDDGTRFCQFITYTYFYADQTTVHHDHSLVVAFDTQQQTIGNIMLPVAVEVGENPTARFAGDEGAAITIPVAGNSIGLLQHDHDAWRLTSGDQSGRRAGGWYGLTGSAGGVFAGLKDIWQSYPAELRADSGSLQLYLWPEQTDPLDFRPSTILGDDYPGDYQFHGPFYTEGLDEMTQAYGLGKTHNLVFDFATTQRNTAWQRLRSAIEMPVLALPDPAYICGTRAFFGRMHPEDREQFPELERIIDSVIEDFVAQREFHEQYGWIDFGDVYNTGDLWRRWGSMFYGYVNVLPRYYLRSGRRDAWEFHRVNTRHVTDIDICHLDSEAFGKERGRRYGGNGGIVHYAANQYPIGCDHHLEFMYFDYYLNGNLRAWEVADYFVRAHAANRDAEPAMVDYQHRHTGGALRVFTEAFQATWEPEYLSIMRQVADILYEAKEREGILRRDDIYMNPAKIMYYQTTGDERMRQLFLDDMNALSEQRDVYTATVGGRGATLSGMAHGFWFTNDKRYLPFLHWQLERLQEGGIDGLRGNRLGRYATYGYQLPQALVVLDEVDELPPPLGPALPESWDTPFALRTNGAFYLQETTDQPIQATLLVDLYRLDYGEFTNKLEWVERLPEEERPALTVVGPTGEQLQRLMLTPELVEEPLELTLPADGVTGTYRIAVQPNVTPLDLWLQESNLPASVAHTGDHWLRLRRSQTLWFRVPAGTGRFTVRIKSARMRAPIHYGIRNAEGETVAENRWIVTADPRNEWEIVELDAGNPGADEAWSLVWQVRGTRSPGQMYVQLEGIPGYVASSSEQLFTPPPALRLPSRPLEMPAGESPVRLVQGQPVPGGTAAFLAEQLTLPADPAETPLLNAERGTVEFWIRTTEPPTELTNRVFFQCGSLVLHQRFNIGTYARIGGNRFHRFFRFPANRWTHLAFTWQPSPEPDADLEIRLFADGVFIRDPAIRGNGSPHKAVPANWIGHQLSLFGNAFYSGLRISDSVRYTDTFTRPTAPFEVDDQTRLLLPFDGSGSYWLEGQRHPLPETP